MARIYEGLFILDTAGKDETSKELIEKLEKDIHTAGGNIQKVERLDKRPFARVARKLESGYYVNIVFEMEPEKLTAFRTKLRLDAAIFRVVFMRHYAAAQVAEAAAK